MSRVTMRAPALVIGFAAVLAVAPAVAQDVSVVVIPGKRGLPILINGIDASYCIVEGELGLARPGHLMPAIVACPLPVPQTLRGGGYFPARGTKPGYGRHEIEPPLHRPAPRPAPGFFREWSTESDPLPAQLEPPVEVPYGVEVGRRRRSPSRLRQYQTP